MKPLDDTDRALVAVLASGLPLVPEPYAEVGSRIGITESDVIARLSRLDDMGVIKRFGIVVQHRELGFNANAMVVWDVPDEAISELGRVLAAFEFVTLCYRRPRRLPRWPYNLFCMVHGKDRNDVRAQIARLNAETDAGSYPNAILFSRKRFKQCGAKYDTTKESADIIPLDLNDRRIINNLQGGFPVCNRPFASAGADLSLSEADMISHISGMCDSGVLSRFGPLYNAERMGGDVILAAMAVPPDRFDEVAETVNAHPEVAHNYARDHRLNMWFVISAERAAWIEAVVAEIEEETGLHVYPMPKEEEYFIGLKVTV